MLYTCSRCKTHIKLRKENMKRHMNRKKPCPISTRKQPHNETQIPHNETQIPHNETQTHHFNCKHCKKPFSRRDSMNRHIRLYCKEFKLKQENVRLQEEIRLLQTRVVPINI